ncbi:MULTISPECIES: alpha-galactosidase [unclassified Oceanispirochaeta]|uniref:alpha-galactosidase n=1 Tax=unclassified Oceanispirochaeta TaxID=2635722 RepID=UPI000E09C87F|nr:MULTISPECIES: alpha-galactosidase [unclassified Oceanispirochaeta]MBF9017691.1 alpha-galactosidase [Oceanispirochaeta sp. M2]NPD72094.1 alpha-galactosidase [Oceanispirochaeta sp. M1]RDG32537.1 alpha-galactosidase [Oceanispirochaeta sp. M1]
MANIVIIGAGSLVFSSRLTADILTFPALEDSRITLVDVDKDRLNYAEQIVQRIFKEGKYTKASVVATMDRREALKDADYVIVSILVGGYEAIEKEIDIPAKYGIDQCIGDTLTPGGIMRCLRTLPVLLEITDDVMELCPRAHVLNYTNPMGMLSWGLQDAAPQMSYVGLCHSVQGTAEEWAKRLEIPFEELNYQCSGINHQAWFTRFEHKGKDMLPSIRELAVKPEIWYGDSTRMEYVKHFGFPVTESSGHVSEYNWWFRKNKETIERYCQDEYSEWNGGSGFIKKLYERPDWKEQMQKMASWEEPVDLERSDEYGSIIINAIETGTPAVIYGNVKNKGFIDNLPDGALVEVPVLVDGNGMHPVRTGALPPHLAGINKAQLNVQELAVRAVQTGDPEFVFQAMALDPLCALSCTLDEIRAMTRELLAAHKPWVSCIRGELADKALVYTLPAPENVEKHIDPATANNIDD